MEDILVEGKFKDFHNSSSRKDFVQRVLRSGTMTMDFLNRILERMVKSDSDEYDIMEEIVKCTQISGKKKRDLTQDGR